MNLSISESDRSCYAQPPFWKVVANFFTYKAVQNPYRRIPIFVDVYKGRQEIHRIPESATPYKIRGKFYLITELYMTYKCSESLSRVYISNRARPGLANGLKPGRVYH